MPARYRLRPVAPHVIHLYGLHVAPSGTDVEVGEGARLDIETLQLIDRTGLCHIERLPDPADPPSMEAQTAAAVAREPASGPEPAAGEPPEAGSALTDRDPPGASGASGGESARRRTRPRK